MGGNVLPKGSRRDPAERSRWEEEEQGSGRSFPCKKDATSVMQQSCKRLSNRRKAEAEACELCDDEIVRKAKPRCRESGVKYFCKAKILKWTGLARPFEFYQGSPQKQRFCGEPIRSTSKPPIHQTDGAPAEAQRSGFGGESRRKHSGGSPAKAGRPERSL